MVQHSGISCVDVAEFNRKYVTPKKGRTLIVGSKIYKTRTDRRKYYEDAVGIDMFDGDGVDRVLNLEEPLPDDLGKFAHIDCISVLEHSQRPWLLASNLVMLMEEGSTIYVQVPFVWRVHGYPSDYWRMTVAGVSSIFAGVRWRAIQATGSDDSGRIPSMMHGDKVYFARTQVCGFGIRE
jgi:hypothetical protein